MSPINNELIRVLKDKTPPNENTVDLLMRILPIGKEAAYRRLRGEIHFSLQEAVSISKALKVSLDLLVGSYEKNIHAFSLNAFFIDNPMEEFYKMLSKVYEAISYISVHDPKGVSYRAYRMIPPEFLYKYKSLSQVYIHVLFYQLYTSTRIQGIQRMHIPEKVFQKQEEVAHVMQDIDSILIFDKRIFLDYIEIIQYFQNMRIIPLESMEIIKKDLHLLVDDIERSAAAGTSSGYKKLDIYISNISFDCTYTYLKGGGYESCSVGLYILNHLSCEKKTVAESHKLWIKSLIRFSTLISASGELYRNRYFSEQRRLIDEKL